MKKIFITVGLSFFVYLLFGQFVFENQLRKKDSLQARLLQAVNENERATFLRLLALYHQDINLDSVLFYGNKLINSTEQLEDKTLLLDALGIVSQTYSAKGNLPKALELCLRGELLQKKNPDLISNSEIPGIGPVYYSLCDIYFQLEDDAKLLKYSDKQLDLKENGLAISLGNYWKAKYFDKQNELDSALIYLLKAMEIIEVEFANNTRFDEFDFNPDSYNLLAKIYAKQGKSNLALAQFQKVLKVHIERDKNLHLANTYNDLAQFYETNGLMDSSIYYAEKALEVSQKIGFVKGKLDAYTLLSEKYEISDPVRALKYYKLALEAEKSLYGSGNIQVLKDMISQKEKEADELNLAKTIYKNRLRTYVLLLGLLALLLVSFIFYRNNKKSRASNEVLANTLQNLKATQSQLIQAEKMASLGELTAGIAHEIQNPLNFVNNFSDVNIELTDEAEAEIKKGDLEEVRLILKDLKENSKKINHHGKRADAILKGMLQHSRTSTGQKEPTDINALCNEYLRLSYHGLKAKDSTFNATMETHFDPNLRKINVIPQDIGRVLLNLINNALQAMHEKSLKEPKGYQSMVKVSTMKTSPFQGGQEGVLITISDNGPGIPDAIKDKIFQPFFTTKPTGQGTGLGLSLSYDIVKAHGGELRVETKEGEGSEFIILLPLV